MSAANKRSLSKDDLRRLMETQKKPLDERKIDSPFARYNSLGQLSCILCNCPIKNEVLWKAHIHKKEHKMNVEHYKMQTVQKPQESTNLAKSSTSNSSSMKRKATDTVDLPEKEKLAKFSESYSEASSAFKRMSSIPMPQNSAILDIKSAVNTGAGYVDLTEAPLRCEDESFRNSDMIVDDSTSQKLVSQNLGAVSDFTKTKAAVIKESSSLSRGRTHSFPEGLPEGFIDDPVLDAKVRNVPYKDKMEEQLELFQKEMKLQETVSEALLEDDDEQRDAERQIYSVEERMFNYSRVLRLVEMKRQATISTVKQKSNVLEKMDQDDEDEDADEDILDWRSKTVFKK